MVTELVATDPLKKQKPHQIKLYILLLVHI